MKAGVYKSLKALDSGLRRNDGISRSWTFYEFIKLFEPDPDPDPEKMETVACYRLSEWH